MQPRIHRESRTYRLSRSARVLQFPALRLNRLTLTDRQEAAQWQAGPAATLCHIMIHADPVESEEIGDFILVYRLGRPWASWGAARRGNRILLWQTLDSTDIGWFPTMAAALAAIDPAQGGRNAPGPHPGKCCQIKKT